MKTRIPPNWMAGAVAVALCLAASRPWQMAQAQDQPPPPAPANMTPVDSTALPPGVAPSSPLAEVIQMAQSGVSETVILTYITNSTSTFNLNSDQIIYLKDLGVPDDIVNAMIQRDQVLQQQGYQPPPQPPPADNTATAEAAPPPPTGDVTESDFYDTLAPYGAWVNTTGYGWCWRPTVVIYTAGWQPYCDHGHWVWTDDGWYWLSDYSWGWATFHYGRWFRDARNGWCWCPDTVWGPSWVTWRYSDSYCGWAPLPPGCVWRDGVGFFYNGAAVGVGFDFGLGAAAFTFVPTQNFYDPHPGRYRVQPGAVAQVYSRTTVINQVDVDRQNRTFVNRGIDPGKISAVTHTAIVPVAIRDAGTAGARGEQLGHDGRTLVVNRPRFGANPSPANRETVSPPARPSPVVGSPYQPSQTSQPSAPSRTGNENNSNNKSSQPSSRQPSGPVQRPGQPAGASGSPVGSEMTTPADRTPSPENQYATAAPVTPPAPNLNYNSTDNRRYPSPRMQQTAPQNPRANYTAPPAEPSPSGGSRAVNSSPPAAENQSRAAAAPSSPPAQSSRSGGNRQNGQ